MDPGKITRPSFPTNQSNSSSTPTASTTSQPTNSATPFSSHPDSGLTTGAKAGIGVGVVGGVVVVVVAAVLTVGRRKRRFRTAEHEPDQNWNVQQKPRELSSSPLDEMAQLETTESAVELPAGYVPQSR